MLFQFSNALVRVIILVTANLLHMPIISGHHFPRLALYCMRLNYLKMVEELHGSIPLLLDALDPSQIDQLQLITYNPFVRRKAIKAQAIIAIVLCIVSRINPF
jgi:hypothetical protein